VMVPSTPSPVAKFPRNAAKATAAPGAGAGVLKQATKAPNTPIKAWDRFIFLNSFLGRRLAGRQPESIAEPPFH